MREIRHICGTGSQKLLGQADALRVVGSSVSSVRHTTKLVLLEFNTSSSDRRTPCSSGSKDTAVEGKREAERWLLSIEHYRICPISTRRGLLQRLGGPYCAGRSAELSLKHCWQGRWGGALEMLISCLQVH